MTNPNLPMRLLETQNTYRCMSAFRPRKAYGDIDAILLFSMNLWMTHYIVVNQSNQHFAAVCTIVDTYFNSVMSNIIQHFVSLEAESCLLQRWNFMNKTDSEKENSVNTKYGNKNCSVHEWKCADETKIRQAVFKYMLNDRKSKKLTKISQFWFNSEKWHQVIEI